ncbi:hypothetical protein [Comamonas antarctica]|uniref:hypothetical protein n=1 Tax=Comamonas antarctica TaxID=2743470 RepID=UPI0028E1900B|nr:hypothetical protein [Comamonas antarctica]
MMREWADFFPDVLPGIAPGTPEPTVVHQLRRAAQAFCTRTRAWRATLEPILTEEGRAAYDMPLPEQTRLVRIESADLQGHGPLTLWRPGRGSGLYLMTPDARTVELSRPPASGVALVLEVTLKPADAAGGIDPDVFDQYSEVIARGALARLRGDEALQRSFESSCDDINVAVWRGRTAARPRVLPFY